MILTTTIVQQLIISADPPKVHTTGVNWESVAVIVAAVVTILTGLGAFIGRYLANRITGSINEFRIDVVNKLDSRLTTVEENIKLISLNNPRYPDDPRENSRRGH